MRLTKLLLMVDIWRAVAPHLARRSTFVLSRVSKHLNSLAWSELIPQCGISFSSSPSETVEKYLSRTPFVSFFEYRGNGIKQRNGAVMEQLKKIRLKKLSWGADIPLTVSILSCISHLIDLESLDLQNDYSFPVQDILSTFRQLKHFGSFCHPREIEPTLALLTQLESLALMTEECPQNYATLDPLTNIKTLTISSYADHPGDFALCPDWTRLETLKLEVTPPINLHLFTNLTSLQTPDGRKSVQALTNLRHLDFYDCGDYSGLTNLTSLSIHRPHIESLRTITSLQNLKKMRFSQDLKIPIGEVMSQMTQLEQLEFPERGSLDFLFHLSNLKSLDLSYTSGIDVVFQNLTKLEHLRINQSRITLDEVKFIDHLTNLTSLTLELCFATNFDLLLTGLSSLTKLETLLVNPGSGSQFSANGLLAISKNFPMLHKFAMKDDTFSQHCGVSPKDFVVPQLQLPRLDQIHLTRCFPMPDGELILSLNELNK